MTDDKRESTQNLLDEIESGWESPSPPDVERTASATAPSETIASVHASATFVEDGARNGRDDVRDTRVSAVAADDATTTANGLPETTNGIAHASNGLSEANGVAGETYAPAATPDDEDDATLEGSPHSSPEVDDLDSGWEEEDDDDDDDDDEPEAELPDERLDPVAYAAAKKAREERLEAKRQRRREKADAKRERRKVRSELAQKKQKAKRVRPSRPVAPKAESKAAARARARAEHEAKRLAAAALEARANAEQGSAHDDGRRGSYRPGAPSNLASASVSGRLETSRGLSRANFTLLAVAAAILLGAILFVVFGKR